MALSNMKVYNDEIVGNTIELLGQKTEKFNAASGGTIVLNSVSHRGSFNKESFYTTIAASQRRVDRNVANAAQAATDLAQDEHVGVKIAGGFGPILFEPSQLTWLEEAPGEAITAIATGFADALLADQLNSSVSAAVNAIENVGATVTTTAPISQANLNTNNALFGDSSQSLRASVMSGKSYHTLVGEAITNTNRLFLSTNVQIVEILGKMIVISDIPVLSAGADKVLTLVPNAISVSTNGDLQTNMDTTNLKKRIETTWQADYTFQLNIKGYAWDVANGGSSPSDAALNTGTNWDTYAADIKHTAGVVLKTV